MGCLEFLIGFIVHCIGHWFAESYATLIEGFIPQKALGGKGRIIVPIVAVIIGCAFLAGLVFGLIYVIIDKGQNVWGWIGVGLGVAYFAAGIALKIAAKRKKRKTA